MLIPLGIVIALGLYVYGEILGDPERLSHIGMISDLGGGQTRIQQVFAYCSGPRDEQVTFTTNGQNATIANISRSTSAVLRTGEIRTTGEGMELPEQKVAKNDTRGFYVDQVGTFLGVVPSVTFDEKGLVGTLENRLNEPIENAVILVNHRTYRVGTLPAETKRPIRIDEDDLLGEVQFILPETTRKKTPGTPSPKRSISISGEFTSSTIPDRLRNELLRQLVNEPGIRGATRTPVLIGHTSANVIDPVKRRKLEYQGWSVVVWTIPLTTPASGTKVFIPSGFVDVNFKGSIWDFRHNQFVETIRPNKIMVFARPPEPIDRIEDATVTLYIEIRASDYRLVVRGAKLDSKGKVASETDIRSFENPTGKLKLTVSDADRFLDDNGRFVFVLYVQRLHEQERNAKISAGKVTWKFTSVKVDLKGTVR